MPAAATASPPPDVFQAIADPTRRRLLDLLRDGEQSAGGLARQFPVSFAAISQHLGTLHAAGLVERRAEGRERIYRLAPARLGAVLDWVAPYQAFWEGRLERLETFLDRRS